MTPPIDHPRIAIVGLGFGAEFFPIYLRHPHAEMAAICQRDDASLNEIGVGRTRRIAPASRASVRAALARRGRGISERGAVGEHHALRHLAHESALKWRDRAAAGVESD